jgi:hypothetical protein
MENGIVSSEPQAQMTFTIFAVRGLNVGGSHGPAAFEIRRK